MVLFINPANRVPGVHTGPTPRGGSWVKHKKNLLLRNHKAQSFHILFVAMYSGPLYKLPTVPLGSIRAPPRGVGSWVKHKKNLLLRNHKAQSFHILFVAMYSGPFYKSCQPCPWGGGGHGLNIKKIFFSEITRPRAFIFCL